ncbi:MAG: hypothetical protein ACTS6G_02250 [Candidatus Hodgkinia cicadicola]
MIIFQVLSSNKILWGVRITLLVRWGTLKYLLMERGKTEKFGGSVNLWKYLIKVVNTRRTLVLF